MAPRTTGLWRPGLISALLLACSWANAAAHHHKLNVGRLWDAWQPYGAPLPTEALRYTSDQRGATAIIMTLQSLNAEWHDLDAADIRVRQTLQPPPFRSGRSKHPDAGKLPDARERRFRR